MSLRRAVHRKAVPNDLEADLLRLAAAIEPLVPKVGPPCFMELKTSFQLPCFFNIDLEGTPKERTLLP